jgi:hypothetical protein
MRLAMLLRRHRGPLTADFRRFYGLRIEDVRARRVPGSLEEFADLACNLPPESATARALDPDWHVTPELGFLRDMAFLLDVLQWRQTKDASRGDNRPEWMPLTEAERLAVDRAAGRDRMTPIPLPEMAALLGWTVPE